jgi:polysaccharide export outer membrane protein
MTMFPLDGGEYVLPERPSFVLSAGDKLQIVFSATDKAAVEPYNAAGKDFFVEDDGSVLLPVLGRVVLAGKTEKEAAALLTSKVSGHLREPFVSLHVTNAVVTVLGEVGEPMQVKIERPVTLLEALGMAGGMTANARRDNIMVQRKEGQKMKIYRINLQTDQLFSSPCYYLKNGDVLYVSPLHTVKPGNR